MLLDGQGQGESGADEDKNAQYTMCGQTAEPSHEHTVPRMLTAPDFEGKWHLWRLIEDRVTGQNGRFEGEAEFVAAGPGRLKYEENGVLRFGAGAPMKATRAYEWDFDPTGVRVAFEDGQPFHRFVPWGEGAGTDHPCGADLYRVHYSFASWPSWSTRWQVSGPRKNYVMGSRYWRE